MATVTPESETPAAQASGDGKSFVAQAQQTVGSAFESTLTAVKENPVTAAAIAAGAAAAVAGAAYGVSQMRSHGGSGGKSKSKG